MKNKIKQIILSCLAITLFFGCETTELNLVESPNNLPTDQGDIDFFLNSIQVQTAYFFEDVTEEGMEVTRIAQLYGPLYDNAYGASNFNTPWSRVYASIISDARTLKPLAEELGMYSHIGVSQILEAYTVATLVDYFGDIPYRESNNGISDNPISDPGAQIYADLIVLLDDAITNLERDEEFNFDNDLFYGLNTDNDEKWIKLANTLKLKLYLQTKLVDDNAATEINSIIASGNYITDAADDFQFNWGTSDNDPDSRHPIFARNFEDGGSITDYMSNHLMFEMNAGYSDKTVVDPRLRYYFYRQGSENATDAGEADCVGSLPPDHYDFSGPYCMIPFPGYWGRDCGDNGGTPPDTGKRATWGLYPIGGNFDSNQYEAIISRNIATNGAGISPIMLSSFVDFMLAEAALTIGTTGDAATYLESGINKSINKVMNFRTDVIEDDSFVPSATDVTDYVTEVMTNFNAANADGKMDIIASEYFIALFGNGIEAFNTYRRTGKPDNLQPLRQVDADNCIRSFLYPDDHSNQNSNVTQKPDVYQKVFWDTNPDTGFIN
ncbi:MAG: SusD/RagB family nutrient-binding outer membrane lipoprotein [Flavobacteriaceae bacterium]|nr:SusD/RagB family nutrient-binding outer membrane lipoprotein [Flavobacteriaceae bacterium]